MVTSGGTTRPMNWFLTLTRAGRLRVSELLAGGSSASDEKPVHHLKSPLQTTPKQSSGNKIFIGHGGKSPLWRELKDFIAERLRLPCEEFNAKPTAGVHTTDRLEAMLSEASMAFLIMTPEDEHKDGTRHARSNVIHEIGLFQGRLGAKRAIVMVEDGCAEFSNLSGLTKVRFPAGDIAARFEEVRRVLEREGLL